MDTATFFLIWSIEHGAWWAPNRNGYVKHRGQAGRYSYLAAQEIVKSANIGNRDIPNEAMVEVEE